MKLELMLKRLRVHCRIQRKIKLHEKSATQLMYLLLTSEGNLTVQNNCQRERESLFMSVQGKTFPAD